MPIKLSYTCDPRVRVSLEWDEAARSNVPQALEEAALHIERTMDDTVAELSRMTRASLADHVATLRSEASAAQWKKQLAQLDAGVPGG